MAEKKKSQRYGLLDTIRGATLISMILYHACWDLVYIFGVHMPWYQTTGAFVWQQSICWTFIFLSGFCLPLGRHSIKRGGIVFGAGLTVTLVTQLFMPGDVILYGVLTLIGSSMLICGALQKYLERISPWLGFAVSVVLFLLFYNVSVGSLGIGSLVLAELPQSWYSGTMSAYFGFPGDAFFSADYFPLLPWFFMFAAGMFANGCFLTALKRSGILSMELRPLSFLGRHSLLIYLLHQPVVYGALMLVF